MLILRWC